MENEFQEYKFKGIRGVDDLKSSHPYYGEWSYFSSYYGVTEEEYKANPKVYEARVEADNNEYINELEKKGELGKEYITIIKVQSHPDFDPPIEAKPYPLSSYKMLILDYGK